MIISKQSPKIEPDQNSKKEENLLNFYRVKIKKTNEEDKNDEFITINENVLEEKFTKKKEKL